MEKCKAKISLQGFSDWISPHKGKRWLIAAIFLLIFLYRIICLEGFYLVACLSAMYLLGISLSFITPIMSNLEYQEQDNPALPSSEINEFKPFIRKLEEFSLWRHSFICIIISNTCTFIQFLDIKVPWPIFMIYFLALCIGTLKKQVSHIHKHGYNPFNFRKSTINFKEEVSSI
ncbi:unnamed protein product [Blepharisma stoltei]|uniref:Protein RER1 n=1 Tax=Blepharisma stoltei TaxID=1481888 RepID=A0AAU9J6F7_9CILI|nr:unnamed protein product [Blepharisma stoltei]